CIGPREVLETHIAGNSNQKRNGETRERDDEVSHHPASEAATVQQALSAALIVEDPMRRLLSHLGTKLPGKGLQFRITPIVARFSRGPPKRPQSHALDVDSEQFRESTDRPRWVREK